MAKLLPQQVEYLKNAKNILLEKRKEYVASCNEFDALASTCYDGVTDLNSLFDVDQIAIIDSRIKKIDTILKDYEIIYQENLSSSKIEIGTIFEATITDEDETVTEKYQLLEQLTDFEGNKDVIPVSIHTSFGKNIYGKEEGYSFEYFVKTNKITGTIDKIHGLIKEETNVKTR